MGDIFSEKICPYCKKCNSIDCNRHINFSKDEYEANTMVCSNYEKDELKIIPYEKPLEVTAKRNYVKRYES